jgi:4-diphosphocytidyl-2-C-methyl-D-erythritol kinase
VSHSDSASAAAVAVFSPAKLNLFLAITGPRADGFHELMSVVTPVNFGDELRVEADDAGEFSLACDQPGVPRDDTNLVLRAARAFRAAGGGQGGAKFLLTKRIPMGAGLGGGSSNAAATLRALNALAKNPLGEVALAEIAAQLGSDCALFLHDGPVVMRGRGERVETLPEPAIARLRGRRALIFKPAFSISTAWAYARMRAGAPAGYLSTPQAEAKLAAWLGDERAPAEKLLFNNMEPPAFAKYPALPVLLAWLRADFGVVCGMSGSGSACFALLEEKTDAAPIVARIREAWGAESFAIETRLR